MNFFDVQLYIVIKLLLILFVIIAIYLVYKQKKPVYLLILVGFISAVAYALLVKNLQLPFWGLQGDEITITAMYNTFAHVSLTSDFSYHQLAPFYPPAWFWIFGLIGRWLNYNGIMIAKVASCFFFLFFPVGLYYFIVSLFKKEMVENSYIKTLAVLSPLLIITILDKDLLIGKPYEVIAVGLTIFWYLGLYLKIASHKFNNKQVLLYGLIGGAIFMTYYLWLVFAAMALLLMGLIEKSESKIKYFWLLFKTMLVTIVVSLPFTLPLVINYFKNGMESWQTAFFTPAGLDLWLPMFKLNSFNSLILFFGLATLIYCRKNNFIKQLSYLFITAFIWWGAGMLSLLIFTKPFQEFRGFYILAPSILAIAAAYGFGQLWQKFNIKDNKNLALTITVIAVMYFATQAIFGFFVDDPGVKNRRVESREANQAVVNLVQFLKTTPNSESELTLQTSPQILAFVPINNLIYFNQHNNHPAAIFSKRYEYVQELANAKSSVDLYEKIKNSPFGKIERLIFYSDKDYYYLYFHLNKIIDGIEEKQVKIKKSLFSPEYFEKVYENNGYVVLNVLQK